MKLKNVFMGQLPIGTSRVPNQGIVPEYDREYTAQEKADIELFLSKGYLVEVDEEAEPKTELKTSEPEPNPKLGPEYKPETETKPDPEPENETPLGKDEASTENIAESPQPRRRKKKA